MSSVNDPRGWIKLHRALQENPMWLSEPFSRGQAWVDLLMLANHKPGHLRVRGNRVDVDRGVVARSKEGLAERWRWSRGKVLRFLRELENDGQIEQQTVHKFTLVRLCNYEEYQAKPGTGDTTDDTTDDTTNDTTVDTTVDTTDEQQTIHIQECKKGKNVKNGRTKTERRKRESVTLPDWMPEGLWRDYVASRRSMKKHPMSVSALNHTLGEIEKVFSEGVPLDRIMTTMTANGWRGCKASWFDSGPRNITPIRRDNSALAARVAAEMEAGMNR